MIVKIVRLAREKRECLKLSEEVNFDSFGLIEGFSLLVGILVQDPFNMLDGLMEVNRFTFSALKLFVASIDLLLRYRIRCTCIITRAGGQLPWQRCGSAGAVNPGPGVVAEEGWFA
jgi:hypothetical protein